MAPVDLYTYRAAHAAVARHGQGYATARLRGPTGGAHIYRGDPSWLSKHLGIHWGNVLKPIAAAAEVVGGVVTGNPLLAAAGGVGIAKMFSKPKRAATKALVRATVSPQVRSGWSAGMGRAAPYSALAPATGFPRMNAHIFRGDDFTDAIGAGVDYFSDPSQSTVDTSSGGLTDAFSAIGSGVNTAQSLLNAYGGMAAPGTAAAPQAIPGLTQLYTRYFGSSPSRAIPISKSPMRPRGYHQNKHGYYLVSTDQWISPGSVWVPNKRRNPLNPRALHRSMARLISAKHAVRKLGLLDVPKRRHARPKYAFQRRSSQKLLKA